MYAAPQLWRCGPSHKTDMWGVGIIAYIILAGYPPFHEESAPEYELNFPRNMTRDAQDFVAQCLCVDPSDRMRSDSALKHQSQPTAQLGHLTANAIQRKRQNVDFKS